MSRPPRSFEYRGFFWPALLILVGVFALLVNTNIISADRLYRLGDLWPVLLVVIGLELLVSRAALPALAAGVAAGLILVLALGGAVAYVALGPAVPGGTQTRDVSEQVGSIQRGILQVDVGAAVLNVRGSGSLGGDLFRAHIQFSGPPVSVSLDRSAGRVEISQTSNFQLFGSQRFTLDLQINSEVPWDITVHSGAATDRFDLSTVRVGSIELDTGASQEDITLGPPSGTVPISVNGGALTVHLHRPSGSAAAVQVSGGAVGLTFDGRELHAIGTVSASTASDGDGYRVQISGGACNVTMDTNSPSG